MKIVRRREQKNQRFFYFDNFMFRYFAFAPSNVDRTLYKIKTLLAVLIKNLEQVYNVLIAVEFFS
jgi:hypothetical protein